MQINAPEDTARPDRCVRRPGPPRPNRRGNRCSRDFGVRPFPAITIYPCRAARQLAINGPARRCAVRPESCDSTGRSRGVAGEWCESMKSSSHACRSSTPGSGSGRRTPPDVARIYESIEAQTFGPRRLRPDRVDSGQGVNPLFQRSSRPLRIRKYVHPVV